MINNIQMKIFILRFFITLICLFCFTNLPAQQDWKKWEKKEFNYSINSSFTKRIYDFNSDNAGEFILKSLTFTYWFFISDVDGDNCPFRPSCSAFFMNAVSETNIIQGALMFADRFTRDINIFKKGNYPVSIEGYYYDPVSLYSLSENKINYKPSNEIVNPE